MNSKKQVERLISLIGDFFPILVVFQEVLKVTTGGRLCCLQDEIGRDSIG